MDSLFLKVTNKSMDNLGRDKVRDEQAVEENTLSTYDHHLHEPTRLAHLHERQEMHSLVVTLLEKCLDPAVVTLHPSEATEMS